MPVADLITTKYLYIPIFCRHNSFLVHVAGLESSLLIQA